MKLVLNKMILGGVLKGSWDEAGTGIVLRKRDPTPLQMLALRVTDAATRLTESNEHLMDVLAGGSGVQGNGGGQSGGSVGSNATSSGSGSSFRKSDGSTNRDGSDGGERPTWFLPSLLAKKHQEDRH